MNIKVTLFGEIGIKAGFNEKVIKVPEEARLSDLIDELGREAGEGFRNYLLNRNNLNVLISGKDYWAQESMKTPLKDGENVVFLDIIFGG